MSEKQNHTARDRTSFDKRELLEICSQWNTPDVAPSIEKAMGRIKRAANAPKKHEINSAAVIGALISASQKAEVHTPGAVLDTSVMILQAQVKLLSQLVLDLSAAATKHSGEISRLTARIKYLEAATASTTGPTNL